MDKKTKKAALGAVLAALQLIILFLGCVMPTARLGFTATAGVITAALLMECGFSGSITGYIAVSLLGILILPQKSTAILFALFFGWYPVIKAVAERRKSRLTEWLIKLAVFNLALILCLFIIKQGFMQEVSLPDTALYFLIPGLNAVFVIYDFGLSGLISVYLTRIRGRIKR